HTPGAVLDASEEAARIALVTCDAARLLHLQEHRVGVAVDADLLDALHVPRGLSLHPERVPRRAPVGGLPGRERVLPRGAVHVGEHEHLARVNVLRDRWEKTTALVEIGLGHVGVPTTGAVARRATSCTCVDSAGTPG